MVIARASSCARRPSRADPGPRGGRGPAWRWNAASNRYWPAICGQPHRLMRALDDELPGAREALRGIYPHGGRAFVVGITGQPPASAQVDAGLGAGDGVPDARGERVAVVAVDPSSPFSGGAAPRRSATADEPPTPPTTVSSSARWPPEGTRAGLSRATSASVAVLDAAGFPVIFVETVGAGQAELDVADAADAVVVVTAPGLGDEVQALKAGLLEIADLLVVNKGDREGADRTLADLTAMLALGARAVPPLLKSVAACVRRRQGSGELVVALERLRSLPAAARLARQPPPGGAADQLAIAGERARACRRRAAPGRSMTPPAPAKPQFPLGAYSRLQRGLRAIARSLERRREAPGGVKIPTMKPAPSRSRQRRRRSRFWASSGAGSHQHHPDITRADVRSSDPDVHLRHRAVEHPAGPRWRGLPQLPLHDRQRLLRAGQLSRPRLHDAKALLYVGLLRGFAPRVSGHDDQPVDRRHAEPLLVHLVGQHLDQQHQVRRPEQHAQRRRPAALHLSGAQRSDRPDRFPGAALRHGPQDPRGEHADRERAAGVERRRRIPDVHERRQQPARRRSRSSPPPRW